jgi:ligand-binding sensor domain-containing protein
MATELGLVAYDGQQFNTFTANDGLPDQSLFSAMEDSEHRIWLGSESRGVAWIENNKVISNPLPQLDNTMINSFHQAGNDIYIGTSKGIFIYNNKTLKPFKYNYLFEENAIIRSISSNNNGYIYIISDPHIYIIHEGKVHILKNQRVTNLVKDKAGRLWGGKRDGLIEFVNDTFYRRCALPLEWLYYRCFATPTGIMAISNKIYTYQDGKLDSIPLYDHLNYEQIYSAACDKEGSIWLGCTDKLLQISPANYTNRYKTNYIPATNTNIVNFANDTSNNLQIWYENNQVVTITHNKAMDYSGYQKLLNPEIYPGVLIWRALVDRNNNTWIVTQDHGTFYYNGKALITSDSLLKGLSSNRVFEVLSDSKKNIWFLCQDIIYSFDGKQFHKHSLPSNDLNLASTMIEDESGRLWFGSSKGVMTFKNNVLKYVDADWNKASIAHTNSIMIAQQKNIWESVYGRGLLCYSIENPKNYFWIEMKNGLPDSKILSFCFDNYNHIWVQYINKIQCIEIDFARKWAKSIFTFDQHSGYRNPVGFAGMVKDKNGHLWVETNQGLITIFPDLLGNIINKVKPFIRLNYLEVETPLTNGINKQFDPTEDLNLNYNNNTITFNFKAASLTRGGVSSYQYTLSGYDDHWSSSKEAKALYKKLPPGEYTFMAKAANCDGYWCDPISYTFTIQPPWWGTWWFRSLMALAFGAIVWLLIKFRLNQIEKKQAHQLAISNSELKALRAQINPHFLFNLFNKANLQILQNKGDAAVELLSNLSTYLRKVLYMSEQHIITLEAEVDYLEEYLQIQQAIHPNLFQYTIDCPENVDTIGIKIPSMLLQPFLENCIVHGFQGINYQGTIDIGFSYDDNYLHCSIKDNGNGFRKNTSEGFANKKHKSMGTEITQKRLELFCQGKKGKGDIQISDHSDEAMGLRGVTVLIKFPIQ